MVFHWVWKSPIDGTMQGSSILRSDPSASTVGIAVRGSNDTDGEPALAEEEEDEEPEEEGENTNAEAGRA